MGSSSSILTLNKVATSSTGCLEGQTNTSITCDESHSLFTCNSKTTSNNINWTLLENLLKKNLREKVKSSNGTVQRERNGIISPNSFASKGISILWFFSWWDQIKLSFPTAKALTIRELWKFLKQNSSASFLRPSVAASDESPFLLYDVVPQESKGFPDFVVAYNPDDNFDEFMKILRYHYYNKEGEIRSFQFIWVDFFLINLHELLENNNTCSIKETDGTDQFTSPLFTQDAFIEDLQDKFGTQIENLMIVHTCSSGSQSSNLSPSSNSTWTNTYFLQNIYSLFYLSFFLWNGCSQYNGKISFLFSKNYCFQYNHLFHFMKEWKPMRLNYYAIRRSSSPSATPKNHEEVEEEKESGQDDCGMSIIEEDNSSGGSGKYSAATSCSKLVFSKNLFSAKTIKEFKRLTSKILSIFETWNTLKVFVMFYMLKHYNISPFFFKEIPSSPIQSHNPQPADDFDATERLYDETPALASDSRSNLWEGMFSGSRMNWKQMSKCYHWYYYDYQLIGNSYSSPSFRKNKNELIINFE
jgi:hypothetical protein